MVPGSQFPAWDHFVKIYKLDPGTDCKGTLLVNTIRMGEMQGDFIDYEEDNGTTRPGDGGKKENDGVKFSRVSSGNVLNRGYIQLRD
jgi:hypothetical protein